jgi:hypothetical protein
MRPDSKWISLIVVFTALGVIADVLVTPNFSAGVWFGWILLIYPISGIILGPYGGFVSTLMAVLLGHWMVPRETIYEFVYTLGAPFGSMMTGFMFRGEWKKVLTYYSILLVFYFITPLSWNLPFWGMWDIYVALIILVFSGAIITIRGKNEIRRFSQFGVSAFIGLEADVLLRIFILVPMGTYNIFFGLTPELLVAIWAVPAPLITPFKVLLSTFFTTMIGPSIERFVMLVKPHDDVGV